MYEKPAAPLSIGGVLEDAFRLYRASFNRAWVPALILQIILTGALFILRIQRPELFDTQGMMLALDGVDPSIMVFYLVAFTGSLIFSNAITAQLLAVRNGQDLSIGGSLATGMRFFLPTLGMALLLSPIGLVGAFVAGAPVADLLRSALAALYALLAVYLMGRVYLAGIALLGDGTGVVGAVRTSWQLTRHFLVADRVHHVYGVRHLHPGAVRAQSRSGGVESDGSVGHRRRHVGGAAGGRGHSGRDGAFLQRQLRVDLLRSEVAVAECFADRADGQNLSDRSRHHPLRSIQPSALVVNSRQEGRRASRG